jgi:hypothetical protein
VTGGRLRAGLLAGATVTLIVANSLHPPADTLSGASRAREADRQGSQALRQEAERRRVAGQTLMEADAADRLRSREEREAAAAARALLRGLRRP